MLTTINQEQAIIAGDHFDQFIALVTNGKSAVTARKYKAYLLDFIAWQKGAGYLKINKAAIKSYLEETKANRIGSQALRLAAIKALVREMADNGLIDNAIAQGVANIKGAAYKTKGTRLGNWLDQDAAQRLLFAPDTTNLQGLRDRAILAIAIGCGLRRSELANLTVEHLQLRQGRPVLIDLIGKGNKTRSVPVPRFAYLAVRQWLEQAEITDGYIFRRIHKSGAIQDSGMTDQAVYCIITKYVPAGIAPHDLRRSFAKLSRQSGGDIMQLSLILGHSSVMITERYIGEKLDLRNAPNDLIDLHLL